MINYKVIQETVDEEAGFYSMVLYESEYLANIASFIHNEWSNLMDDYSYEIDEGLVKIEYQEKNYIIKVTSTQEEGYIKIYVEEEKI